MASAFVHSKTERHQPRPGTSLFALVKYGIDHTVDGCLFPVRQLIPSVDQVLLFGSKEAASVPFIKELRQCDPQPIAEHGKRCDRGVRRARKDVLDRIP